MNLFEKLGVEPDFELFEETDKGIVYDVFINGEYVFTYTEAKNE
jgi:hypothetical protein